MKSNEIAQLILLDIEQGILYGNPKSKRRGIIPSRTTYQTAKQSRQVKRQIERQQYKQGLKNDHTANPTPPSPFPRNPRHAPRLPDLDAT